MTNGELTLERNLGDKIAEVAERRVGKVYNRQCGEFVREVLASEGILVRGLLRNFGWKADIKQRTPGDVVFFYTPDDYADNIPFTVGIMTGLDRVVLVRSGRVVEGTIKFVDNQNPYATIEGLVEGYVSLRKP